MEYLSVGPMGSFRFRHFYHTVDWASVNNKPLMVHRALHCTYDLNFKQYYIQNYNTGKTYSSLLYIEFL
jgi:hypothetical protein